MSKSPSNGIKDFQGKEVLTVQRLKRVSEVNFIGTVRGNAVVLVIETFPYWLLELEWHKVIYVSYYGRTTFDPIFDSLQQDVHIHSILKQLIARIGVFKCR